MKDLPLKHLTFKRHALSVTTVVCLGSLFVGELASAASTDDQTQTLPKKKKKKKTAPAAATDSSFDFSGGKAATPAPAAAPVQPSTPLAAPVPASPPLTPTAAPTPAAPAPTVVNSAPPPPPPAGKKGRRTRTSKSGIVFDFSEDNNAQADVKIDLHSPEKERFDRAMDRMADERWTDAALEWTAILEDPNSQPFYREAEYQLAKATYRLGLYNAALSRFESIIAAGDQHPRYQKAVEWLFFISRKLVDETPVLEELATFRDVQWPRKYRNEYRYLLAKRQYLHAYQLEVDRLKAEEQAKYQATAAPIDTSGNVAMDFSQAPVDSGGGMDFSNDTSGGASAGVNTNIGSMEFSANDLETGEKKTEKVVDVVADARRLVGQIPFDSKYYPRAKYLEGLLDFLEGQDQLAVDAFRQVIQILNPKKGKNQDPKLREAAFFSLARAHYGYGQFRAAAYYYSKIDHESDQWLDALFESSWAYFRSGDYEKALGNLVTLHSPFFINEYYPEAQILKAVIYFDNCRYQQVKEILTQFNGRYRPLMEDIKKFNDENQAPEQYYNRLGLLTKDPTLASSDMTRILNIALSDREVRRADASVREVQHELVSVNTLPKALTNSTYAQSMKDVLGKVLTSRLSRAGDLAHHKLDEEYLHLRSLVGQAYRIQFETVTSEKNALEAKLTGEGGVSTRIYNFSAAVDDEKLFWPFDGEYWRDEQGTYQYTLAAGCK